MSNVEKLKVGSTFLRIDFWHVFSVTEKFRVSVDWLRTGEADERNPVDDRLDRLIEWLRLNPEIARELRIKAGLD